MWCLWPIKLIARLVGGANNTLERQGPKIGKLQQQIICIISVKNVCKIVDSVFKCSILANSFVTTLNVNSI